MMSAMTTHGDELVRDVEDGEPGGSPLERVVRDEARGGEARPQHEPGRDAP